MKKRKGDPWMSASEYGHTLPTFSINLLVKNIELSCKFYSEVFEAEIKYRDEDFAAVNLHGLEFMLHADHTFENHPWTDSLGNNNERGLGVELRVLGINPDKIEKLARKHKSVIFAETSDKPHGWRETVVQDPDGYVWAAGIKIPNLTSA